MWFSEYEDASAMRREMTDWNLGWLTAFPNPAILLCIILGTISVLERKK